MLQFQQMASLNKSFKLGAVVAGSVAIVIITILSAIYVSAYIENKDKKITITDQQCAYEFQNSYKFIIKNDKLNPRTINAHLCDTITITNQDNKTRLIAFGKHEKHEIYDGVSAKRLDEGQSFFITLVSTGKFKIHDHDQESVQAVFSVKR